jgi:integrase
MTAEILTFKKIKKKVWSTEGLNPKLDHNLHVYVPTGMIYVKKRFGSLGIPDLERTPTGFTIANKLKARAKRDEIIEKHKARHMGEDHSDDGPKRKKVRLISSIIDELLVERPKGNRERTLKNYDLYFRKIREYWGNKTLSTITQKSFDKWIEIERRKTKCIDPSCEDKKNCKIFAHQGLARRTFSDYAKYMNILYRYSHEKKYTPYILYFKDPDKILKNELLEKKRQEDADGQIRLTPEEKETLELQSARLLTRDEIKALWDVMGEEHRDQFACAFLCIMRKRETLEAPWSEIDLENGVWTLPPWRVKTGSKTGKGRSFRIAPEALERLRRRHKELNGKSKYVFPGWSRKNLGIDKPVNDNKRAWNTAKCNAKILGKLRWHDIRHTALTFALLGDPSLPEKERNLMKRDPEEVSQYAGVSMNTIRRVYLRTQVTHTESVSTAIKLVDFGKLVSPVFPQSGENEGNFAK